MHKLLLLALCAGCFATSLGPRFYLTATPRTLHAPTADSVIVHFDEKMMMQLNTLVVLGRKEQLEQAACLRVEKVVRGEVYVDSVLSAAIVPGATTMVQVVYSCPVDAVPWHAHIVFARDGWDQCIPSPIDLSSAWSRYPAEVMQCGIGVDSVVTWKAKR